MNAPAPIKPPSRWKVGSLTGGDALLQRSKGPRATPLPKIPARGTGTQAPM